MFIVGIVNFLIKHKNKMVNYKVLICPCDGILTKNPNIKGVGNVDMLDVKLRYDVLELIKKMNIDTLIIFFDVKNWEISAGVDQIGDLTYSFNKYICDCAKQYCKIRVVLGAGSEKAIYKHMKEEISKRCSEMNSYLILKSKGMQSQRRLFNDVSHDYGIKIMDVEALLLGKKNLEHSKNYKLLKRGKELMNSFNKELIPICSSIKRLTQENIWYHKGDNIYLTGRIVELKSQRNEIKQKIIALAKDIKAIKKSIKESQRKYNSKEE